MWQTYKQPTSLAEALELLEHHRESARIIAGGTDVLIELQRGVKPTSTLIDITRLNELRYLRRSATHLHLGALATHNAVLASPNFQQAALPLVQACWEVGAPQIRNRATIAGNLITASPANDTITPLVALNAELVLVSCGGERIVPLKDFYRGVRNTILQPAELLSEIRVPIMQPNERGLFLKLGLRRAQAISVINAALILTIEDEHIREARVTLGCLAPTIVHATTVENFLQGQPLTQDIFQEAGKLALEDVSPISDIRASAGYRQSTLATFISEGLRRLAQEPPYQPWHGQMALLETPQPTSTSSETAFAESVATTINGQPTVLDPAATRKTLLNALREDAGLTGTKEGCAEGECGACTVWLNGQAVMSCVVPAAQAHNGTVTTIEGLAESIETNTPGNLHPLQQAFIDKGAVQCGFCIPGMLMAGAKLLDEYPRPALEQVRTALSGNLCRCTGYSKILQAVISAGDKE
jgi:carbon-monoxide dehydrogenase medium subunit